MSNIFDIGVIFASMTVALSITYYDFNLLDKC